WPRSALAPENGSTMPILTVPALAAAPAPSASASAAAAPRLLTIRISSSLFLLFCWVSNYPAAPWAAPGKTHPSRHRGFALSCPTRPRFSTVHCPAVTFGAAATSTADVCARTIGGAAGPPFGTARRKIVLHAFAA